MWGHCAVRYSICWIFGAVGAVGADRQTDRQTDRQADRQTGRQTDRQRRGVRVRALVEVIPNSDNSITWSPLIATIALGQFPRTMVLRSRG